MPFFAIALAAVVGLLSCGPESTAAAPGQRVVSLAPSITETLFAIGAGDSVVGVTDFCDWPAEARKIPRVGSYVKPNVEAVVARRPDLVLVVPTPGNREPVLALEKLGLRIVVVAEGPALEDVLGSIRTIAGVTGREAAGATLLGTMRKRLDALREPLRGVAARRAAFVVDRNPLVVAGGGTLIDELLGIAGGVNVAAGLGPWPRLSLEFLVREDPEVILDGAMAPGADRGLGFYEGLGLRAAKQGKIHAVRLDEIMRPGPRVVDGLENLIRLLHPETLP